MFLKAVIAGLFLSAAVAAAQQQTTLPPQQPARPDQQAEPTHDTPQPPLTAKPQPPAPPPATPVIDSPDTLPDAPSAALAQQEEVVVAGKASLRASGKEQPPCNFVRALGLIYFNPNKVDAPRPRCSELIYPYQRFLDTNIAVPLNWKQKGYLAAHFTTDPSALGTVVGISAISTAADSHSAYGPGLKGFGKLAGISVLQNATAEFFGTFAVPSLTHQDPRYYRMPQKPFGKRLLYAASRSYISRSDDGRTIPNYGTLAAYPIVAELSNLYVPGIQSDGASTAERILTGLALDPVNNIVNEFLPDLASRVHVRIIFVQQILNNIAASGNGVM
jgi:hypothetical protein